MESIFVNCYLERVAETGSVICPVLSPIPEHISLRHSSRYRSYRQSGIGRFVSDAEYCLYDIIGAIAQLVPAVEFKAPSYLIFEKAGKDMLARLIEQAHNQRLLVILDVSDTGLESGKTVVETFDEYRADAYIFGSLFDLSSCQKWLRRGHMVIFTSLERKDAELSFRHQITEWIAKAAKITHGTGGVGWLTRLKEAVTYRQILSGNVDDAFFYISIPGSVCDCGIDEVVSGLMNSRQQPMGIINSSDITFSCWDIDKGKSQKAKTHGFDPTQTAIQAVNKVNTTLHTAIERKLGKNKSIFSG